MADVETSRPRRVAHRLSAVRDRIKRTRSGALAYRIAITLLGLAVIAVGIVLLPLPGPGWLIIFAGLGLLATEYEWASRLLRYTRDQVGRWTGWAQSRSRPAKAVIALGFLVLAAAVAYAAWYVYVR